MTLAYTSSMFINNKTCPKCGAVGFVPGPRGDQGWCPVCLALVKLERSRWTRRDVLATITATATVASAVGDWVMITDRYEATGAPKTLDLGVQGIPSEEAFGTPTVALATGKAAGKSSAHGVGAVG